MATMALGIADLLARGERRQARRLAQQRLRRHPDSAAARYDRGLVELVDGRFVDAVHWIQAAIALDAGQPRFHCNLGQALLRWGKPDEAIVALRRALALNLDGQSVHPLGIGHHRRD